MISGRTIFLRSNARRLASHLERILKLALFFLPGLLVGLSLLLSNASVPISLLLHGRALAQVVPKTQLGLNVFKFVPVDNLRAAAIVFSGARAVGWIEQPMFGVPYYVPFQNPPSFDQNGLDLLFDLLEPLLNFGRPYLIITQVLFFVFWLAYRRMVPPGKCRRCGYDLRATPDRCPECGTNASSFAAALRDLLPTT